jgi:hypothetical protein
MPLISYPRTDGTDVLISARESFRTTGFKARNKKLPIRLKHALGLIEFADWIFQTVIWKKRETLERERLRKEFNNKIRAKFLKSLAKNKEELINRGMSEKDIQNMQKGNAPKNYQVHHKIPLDDGGTNDLNNLVLLQNAPYHEAIHSSLQDYQKQIMVLNVGEVLTLSYPVPAPGATIWPPSKNQSIRVVRQLDPMGIKNRDRAIKRFAERGIDIHEELI